MESPRSLWHEAQELSEGMHSCWKTMAVFLTIMFFEYLLAPLGYLFVETLPRLKDEAKERSFALLNAIKFAGAWLIFIPLYFILLFINTILIVFVGQGMSLPPASRRRKIAKNLQNK